MAMKFPGFLRPGMEYPPSSGSDGVEGVVEEEEEGEEEGEEEEEVRGVRWWWTMPERSKSRMTG